MREGRYDAILLGHHIRHMKRICIFSFYEKDGFVDDYVFYLLKELRINVDTLFIVINGDIQKCFKDEMSSIADTIIYRENRGFDAGAYKSVLIYHLSKEKIHEYDEVILCNNTFYGPVVSLSYILEVMEKRNCDFWGLNYVSPTVVDYMQSYFLAFREGIIRSDVLYDFFRNHIDENNNDIVNDYVEFETGITQFVVERGFSVGSFATPSICDIYMSSNYGIKKYGVPIIKNKAVLKNNTKDNFIDAVQYVERNTDYDINLIKNHIKRMGIAVDYNNHNLHVEEYSHNSIQIAKDELSAVTAQYDYVYIYGAGSIARKVYRFYKLYNVKAFIISDGQEKKNAELYGIPVLFSSQVNNSNDVCIVVAMSVNNSQQIHSYIDRFNNVIYPW